jgi:exonuclease III
VINKDIAIHKDIVSHEIIPGRALLISMPWHSDMMLTMLNVYAPNNASENENFWADIAHAFDTQPIPLPDVMMGDFNMVKDAIDRLPSHSDNAATCKSLFELRSQLSLKDSWRAYNGNEKGYTYLQKPNMIRS